MTPLFLSFGLEQFVNDIQNGQQPDRGHEDVLRSAFEFRQCRCFTDGVHRQQTQQRGDDWRAHGFDKVENVRVGVRNNPGGTHNEDHTDRVQFAHRDFRLIALVAELQDQTVQPFQGAQVVTEEGFKDSDQRDDGRAVFQHGGERGFTARHRGEMVRQVREHRNILRFRIGHVLRREREQAAKGEEHHHGNHQQAGAANDFGTFLLGEFFTKLWLVLLALGDHKRGDNRREVEGEHHDGDPQPHRNQNTVMAGKGDIAQVDLVDHRRVPVRDQRQGNQHQTGDKREHQEAHHLHHQVFTKPDNKGHQQQQEQRHKAAVQRGHLELVFPEGHKGVSNGDAVNP